MEQTDAAGEAACDCEEGREALAKSGQLPLAKPPLCAGQLARKGREGGTGRGRQCQ